MEGRISKLFEVKSGTAASGKPWTRRDVLLDLRGGASLLVAAWGDNVAKLAAASEGMVIEFDLSVKSREWKGRWYTEATFESITLPELYSDTGTQAELPLEEPPDDLPF